MWLWIVLLNLHQDIRSSNGLGIHSTLSLDVQCHCPRCLLRTPLGSHHMQKKYCVVLERKLVFWS